MCVFTGITLGTVGTAVSIVSALASTAIGVAGALQQAKSTQEQYNYQAQVAKQNAQIANDNAAVERQQGIEEERLQRMKTLAAISSQKTAMAANGVDITQGTAVDVISDTAAMGELDALQTRYNYERKALAYESEANNFQNQANLDTIAGKNAYSAGMYNGLASGLSGLTKVGDVASKWYSGSSINSSSTNSGMKINKSMKNQWAIAGLSA